MAGYVRHSDLNPEIKIKVLAFHKIEGVDHAFIKFTDFLWYSRVSLLNLTVIVHCELHSIVSRVKICDFSVFILLKLS